MNKEQLIEDFFRSLKVTLTNSFSYSKDHPYFIKSVESFKIKLQELLIVLNPLKIGVTTSGFVVDSKDLIRTGFYDEPASLLHQRKIKSIEISSGVSLNELIQFFSVISLPQKEIFKFGGINVILNKGQLSHFKIEELDYSVFLQKEGKECVDIWGYMLKGATASNDQARVDKLADDFGLFLKRANEKDVFDSEEVPANINDFLVCLKENNKDKFDKCSKDIFIWLLNNKQFINDEKLAKIKSAFQGLNPGELSSLLLEGVLEEDNFDFLSLELFSKISDQKNHQKIADEFLDKASESGQLKNNQHAVKRIQDLLISSKSDQLSAVYRNTLESLAKKISSSGNLFFDQAKLKQNYRYIVLSMFSIEKSKDNFKKITELLEKELFTALNENDIGFFDSLYTILQSRKKEGAVEYIDFEKKVSFFIEDIILNKTLLSGQESLIQMITLPSKGVDFYLNKLFNSTKLNKQLIGLFFRLFKKESEAFYQRLNQKQKDIEFLADLIDALGQFNLDFTVDILEQIYLFGNDLIKSEVLKAMHKLKQFNTTFLIQQLDTDSFTLRKNILSVLILDAHGKNKALELLLKHSDFWGSKNNLLNENMQIVFELKIIEAVEYIRDLSYRKFFWNRKLRNKALWILKEWNV